MLKKPRIRYIPIWDHLYTQMETSDGGNQLGPPFRKVDFLAETTDNLIETDDVLIYISFGFGKNPDGTLSRHFEYKDKWMARRVEDVFRGFPGMKYGYVSVLISVMHHLPGVPLTEKFSSEILSTISDIVRDIEGNQKILPLPMPPRPNDV